ncbi:MAG: hypothetical protein OXG27_11520 [Chloroflexi bacterium]|nr:hypothetical protein [Chloroflexota bacterium]
MALDKLRFHNILVGEMGAPSEAATELADVVGLGIDEATEGLATKQDLQAGLWELRLELLHAFKDEMNRLLRWMMAAGITIGGAIIALLIALIVRGS